MILQALYEYYQKHKDELPRPGLGQQEIKYMIVLEEDGSFAYLEERSLEGRECFFLPKVKRGTVNAWQTPLRMMFPLACIHIRSFPKDGPAACVSFSGSSISSTRQLQVWGAKRSFPSPNTRDRSKNGHASRVIRQAFSRI